MKHLLVLIILILIVNKGFAQSNNNMLFENGEVLNFDTEPPALLDIGQNQYYYFKPFSYSNKTGKLLFYGDHDSVFMVSSNAGQACMNTDCYDRYHTIILEASKDRFYIFKTRHIYFSVPDRIKKCYLNSIDYQIVDLNMGGLLPGIISICNDTVMALTAYKIKDYDYWLVGRKLFGFVAFRITNGEIIQPPVYSKIFERNIKYLEFSKLVFSHDGGMLISANSNYYYGKFPMPIVDSTNGCWIYVYDFDAATGKVSNGQPVFNHYKPHYSTKAHSIYVEDIEFSSNDSIFYITLYQSPWDYKNKAVTDSLLKYSIHQYQRYSKNIGQTCYLINTYRSGHNGWLSLSLELGPNSKIYVGENNTNPPYTYSIIWHPDSIGAKCKYIPKASTLNSSGAYYISTHVESHRKVSFFMNHRVCEKQMVFKSNCHPSFNKFKWYVEQDSFLIDSAEGEQAIFSYTGKGVYYVKLKATDSIGYSAWYSDSIWYNDVKTQLTANFYTDTNIACRYVKFKLYDSSSAKTIHPKKGESWQWYFDDTLKSKKENAVVKFNETGHYTVKLVYSNGYCYDTIVKTNDIKIIDAPLPGFEVADTFDCVPFGMQLKSTANGNILKILYQTDSLIYHGANPEIKFNKAGYHKIKQYVYGTTGCISYDSIIINAIRGYTGNEASTIQYVSITDIGNIEIKWLYDQVASNAQLIRESVNDTLSYKQFRFDKEICSFTDVGLKTNSSIYSYKIRYYDSCNHPNQFSTTHNSMLLNGLNYKNEYSELSWNKYNGWSNGVESYTIIEIDTVLKDTNDIASVSPLKNMYRDLDFFQPGYFGKIYKIKATELNGNYTTSYSNKVSVEYIPKIWIPNSFTPNNDGLNDRFKIIAIGLSEYQIQIFNRWGMLLYESTDQNDGWDGIFKEKNAPAGVYMYLIRGKTIENKYINLNGSIHLIK